MLSIGNWGTSEVTEVIDQNALRANQVFIVAAVAIAFLLGAERGVWLIPAKGGATVGRHILFVIHGWGEFEDDWGENIAVGQRDPEEVVSGWLESDGHCSNIMNPSFEDLGVGAAIGATDWGEGIYWTQNFGAVANW